jgi:hypothetical protein
MDPDPDSDPKLDLNLTKKSSKNEQFVNNDIKIRIGNPDSNPGARKLRNFSGKNALFSYLNKKFYH